MKERERERKRSWWEDCVSIPFANDFFLFSLASLFSLSLSHTHNPVKRNDLPAPLSIVGEAQSAHCSMSDDRGNCTAVVLWRPQTMLPCFDHDDPYQMRQNSLAGFKASLAAESFLDLP